MNETYYNYINETFPALAATLAASRGAQGRA